jgi:hypothetical protein
MKPIFHFKMTSALLILLNIISCSWKNNLLGNKTQSSIDYNSIQVTPPPNTPFSVNIEKGILSGPCLQQQEDLTSKNTICFEVVFERAPLSFGPSNIILSQPSSSANVVVTPTDSPIVYTVQIQNYSLDGSNDGIYSIHILPDSITDNYGNMNLASISTDNNVEVSQYTKALPLLNVTAGGTLAPDSCQGLDIEIWSQPNLSSLNTFFNGSPGTSPSGAVVSGLVDNLLNADHLEFRPTADNYAIQWTGYIEIKNAGNYQFRTTSDDGSRFYLNNNLVVNNDGLHGNVSVTSSNINLSAGIYPINLQFFERTGGENIVFVYSGPDTGNAFISPASEIFQPANCPAVTSIDKSMISSYSTASAPFNNGLVGLVRDDSIHKHIKVSIDEDDFLKINTGSEINGTQSFSTDNLKLLASHNDGSLSLTNPVGITSQGMAWFTMSRIWRLQCDSLNDQVMIQVPASDIDPLTDSIIFSQNILFNQNVRPKALDIIGGQKAYTFKCSDFESNIQYFTFGHYNL